MERNSSRLMRPRTVGSRRIGLVVCLLYESISTCIFFFFFFFRDLSSASEKVHLQLTVLRLTFPDAGVVFMAIRGMG